MPKLLLVDDSPAIRSFIKVLLSAYPFEFLEADDGERALRLARIVPVDLVIADINMPVLDGLSFVLRLRASQEEHLRRLPVALLTADTGDDLEARAAEAGANFFLRKPVSGERLRSIVNMVFESASQGPASEAHSGTRLRSTESRPEASSRRGAVDTPRRRR